VCPISADGLSLLNAVNLVSALSDPKVESLCQFVLVDLKAPKIHNPLDVTFYVNEIGGHGSATIVADSCWSLGLARTKVAAEQNWTIFSSTCVYPISATGRLVLRPVKFSITFTDSALSGCRQFVLKPMRPIPEPAPVDVRVFFWMNEVGSSQSCAVQMPSNASLSEIRWQLFQRHK
jgi:hypothetical protein